MHSTHPESTSSGPTAREPVSDAAVRIVYNAVRTLVPERRPLALADLLAVTRLDSRTVVAAMDHLAWEGLLSVSRLDRPAHAWHVRRTDR